MYSGHSQFSFIWYTSIFDPSRESKSLLRELYCQYVLSHSLRLVHSGELGNNLVEFHKIVQCPQKLLLGTWQGSTLYRRLIWTTWVPFQHGDFPSESKRCVNVISFLSLFLHLLVISCSYAGSTYVTSSIMSSITCLRCVATWNGIFFHYIIFLFYLFLGKRMISAYQFWEKIGSDNRGCNSGSYWGPPCFYREVLAERWRDRRVLVKFPEPLYPTVPSWVF